MNHKILLGMASLTLIFFLVSMVPPSKAEPGYLYVESTISSSHPYPDGASLSWEVGAQGVATVRVKFAQILTEEGYDFVTVYAGDESYSYSGHYGEFWTPWISAEFVAITFTSDERGNGYGFDIVGYEVSIFGGGKPSGGPDTPESTGEPQATPDPVSVCIISLSTFAVLAGCFIVKIFHKNQSSRMLGVIPHQSPNPHAILKRAPQKMINTCTTQHPVPTQFGGRIDDERAFLKELKERPMYVAYQQAIPSQRRHMKMRNPRLARLAQRVHKHELKVCELCRKPVITKPVEA